MRVHARMATALAAVTLVALPGVAFGAVPPPAGPATAQTVASAQAGAASAATASTNAARDAATAQVALDAAKAASTAAAAAAAANPTPENVAAAAAASAAQATAQQNYDAKAAAATAAATLASDSKDNADREAASFARLNGGTTTEGTTEIPEQTPGGEPQPDNYLHSDNVSLVGHVRGLFSTGTGTSCPAFNPTKCPGYSSLNFLHFDNLGYDVMVANGTAGLSVWSLKDPAKPKWIGQVTLNDLKGAQKQDPNDPTKTVSVIPDGATMTQFWEGENMTVDSRRKLAFMSRDTGQKGQIIVDLKDPWNPKVINFSKNFQGHTSTCLNDCRFMWSVGGTQGAPTPGKASPVSVTDMRDPLHPFVYPTPLASDVARTGAGGSTHSVDVDFNGVAWVSGSSGVRGYWTEGTHKDPATGQDRFATPYDPIAYAGGRIGSGSDSSFMHNAYHVPGALGDQKAGDTLLVTNENNNTTCTRAGVFIVASLKGVYDGVDTITSTTRMERLAAYSTDGKPGQFHGTVTTTNAQGQPVNTTVGDCSAHWFTVKGNIVAFGNYEQGTRFVDISDPRNPQQVGYFRVPARAATADAPEIISSDTAGAYWHGKYVYVADYQRGVDVIKLDDSALRGKIQPKACWNSCEDAGQSVDPMSTSQTGGAGASVPATLALTLGTPASFVGGFTPGVAKDYTASSTANVISTAGDATLSIADPSATATGHLVNGAFSLPSALQAKAASPAGTGGALKDVGGSSAPTSLLTYSGPISNDPVAVTFQQHIGSSDALRTGSYTKTLTFTLSTTTP